MPTSRQKQRPRYNPQRERRDKNLEGKSDYIQFLTYIFETVPLSFRVFGGKAGRGWFLVSTI